MSATKALLKKEFTEQWRTNKVLIMAATFFVLGVSGPLTTKFLPEIIKSSSKSAGISFGQITISLTTADFAASFFSQMTQLPILILILLTMGAVAGEREHGTQVFVLTKPIRRTQYILTKFFAYLAVLTGVVMVAALGGAYYTLILSNTGNFSVSGYLMLSLTMWSDMVFLLALILLCSSLVKTSVAAGGLSFLLYIAIAIANGLTPSDVSKYLPQSFAGQARDVMNNKIAAGDLIIAVLVGLVLAVIIVGLTCVITENREM